ncbi:MAG: hypothetical protein PHV32_11090, partial [Eubacteriales bacterium]|nr:hypothetical protein [Eubacteriales bacterium]
MELNLVNYPDPMYEYGVNYSAGVKYAVRVDDKGNMIPAPAEIVYLDLSSITGEADDLSAINASILSNYDTGKLNEIQVRSLEQWVEAGGILITGTGANAQKVYSGLTEKLKQYKITGSGSLAGYQALGDAIEKTVPEGALDIALGSTGDGAVLLKEGEYPLAISYPIGNGCEIVLAYDPSLEPIAGWVDSAQLMAYLINEGTKTINRKSEAGGGVDISLFNNVASDVPESAAPPFGLITIILAIYLVIVGPILYILLKKKDKRDLSWFVIPALAFVFMFVIYVAGFKSRYTTAVLNTFSIIDIDAETGEGKVASAMAAFNNRKGTFRIEYDSSKDISTYTSGYNNYYYNPNLNPSAGNAYRKVTEKIIYSDKRINEYYDVGIWEKVTLNGNTEIKTDGGIIRSASLSGGMFSASIENNTPFELKESFITIGDSVIEIGDILPGETREISEQLNNLKTISEYLNSKYYIDYSNTSRRERTELDRKRSIINGLARNSFVNLDYLVNLYAFNDSHIDYGIIVNGAQPVNYDTNVILAHTGDLFRESGVVELPYGTIVPYIIPDKGFYYDSGPDGYIQIDMEAEVYVDFEIPAQLAVEEFTVSWSSKLNNNFGGSAKQAGFTFEIYNNEAQDWEEFTDRFTPSGESNKYIDNTNRVRLKLVGEKINGV